MNCFSFPSPRRYYFLLMALIFEASIAASQTFEVTKAEITVEGIAREKPWAMTAHAAEGTTDMIFRDNKLAGVQLLKLSVNVADLKSQNAKMDQRAHKALKSYPYDRIQFLGKVMKLTEVGPDSYILLAEGNLYIGGITQINSVLVNIHINSDGTITCTGTREIKLDDFKVKLPPAEHRLMRLSDNVQVHFQLTLAKARSGAL